MSTWTVQRHDWFTEEWSTVFIGDDSRAELNATYVAATERSVGNHYRMICNGSVISEYNPFETVRVEDCPGPVCTCSDGMACSAGFAETT